MDNNKMIKVTNISVGSLGYTLPELHIKRHFTPKETKEISFGELFALYNSEGGRALILNKLAVKDKAAIDELGFDVEREYFYTEDQVKDILVNGSQAAFLDLLDFAPEGILDIVKSLAVSLPLNDVAKRDAIFEKLNFNVTKAIEIQNTRFDDGSEDTSAKQSEKVRRVADDATSNTADAPKRRVVRREE